MKKTSPYKIIHDQSNAVSNRPLPPERAKTGKYGGESSKAAFWQRLQRTLPLLNLPKSSYHLFGYLSDVCEYDRPELNITTKRLAFITTLSPRQVQIGMAALRHANIIVPYENRFYVDHTRPPKGGKHKAVKYDVKNFHAGWDLAGLNGLSLWLAVCELCRQQNDEAFNDFMGKMTFKRMQKIENGDYLIILSSQFDAMTERFNAEAISNKMSDIATDLSGVGVIIIAQGDRQQTTLSLIDPE